MKLHCIERALVEKQLSKSPVPVSLILPNGDLIGEEDAAVLLKARTYSVLSHLATGNVGRLGSSYVQGELDITGSPREIMQVAVSLLKDPTDHAPGFLHRLVRHVLSMARHTLKADARQIETHYDISDGFYALWLDHRRVYSCAYYNEPGLSLEFAQQAKLRHICTKLMLKDGDRFLDVGAGWGGLLLYAAERYDIEATGITLSKRQYEYITKLLEDRPPLRGRVKIKLLDYRELNADPGPRGIPSDVQYDKIASVGMFEHVGRANLPVYFRKLETLLRPGGLLLNHGITAGGVKNRELGGGMGRFIQQYIFPGGELHHISHVLEQAAEVGLEVLDVENLRPHYAKTLWAWSDGLEAHLAEARELVGENIVRAYRMYLAGCAASFERGWLSLHQVLVARAGEKSSYPFNREFMYRD